MNSLHTETYSRCRRALNRFKQWANVHRLKHGGVPVIGFTWYSLLHQVDWDSPLRNDADNVNDLGIYDLDPKIMPIGEAYRELIKQWKDVITEERFGLIYKMVNRFYRVI